MVGSVPAQLNEPELGSMIQAYSEVTERLKHSHERLVREVCRLREELIQKNKELERRERLAALGQMAAGVAHEIRNPLGGIGLYTSLLERDLADRPEQLSLVRRMSVGIRNLDGIVGDILTFAGDGMSRRRSARLGSILEAVLIQVAPRVEAEGIDLQIDESLADDEVYCDAGQLERALINLAFNAIDAAGRDGRVWFRASESKGDPDFVRMTVEDNGPGIPDALRHRVFDPFFTTKDTGTGLGLAIVHRMLESNGGSIVADARAGGGAMFLLTVPRYQVGDVEDTDGGYG